MTRQKIFQAKIYILHYMFANQGPYLDSRFLIMCWTRFGCQTIQNPGGQDWSHRGMNKNTFPILSVWTLAQTNRKKRIRLRSFVRKLVLKVHNLKSRSCISKTFPMCSLLFRFFPELPKQNLRKSRPWLKFTHFLSSCGTPGHLHQCGLLISTETL